MLRQAAEHHQVERIVLRIAAAAEVVAIQKHRFAQGDRRPQLQHHPLIGRGSVDDREQSISVAHVLQVGLGHPPGPALLRQIHLAIAAEGLPHLQPQGLEGGDEIRQQPLAPVGREAVGRGEVEGGAGHRGQGSDQRRELR